MSNGSPPKQPSLEEQVKWQQIANNNSMWQNMWASRPNSSNPYGTSTWTHTRNFDKARFDADMAKWQAENKDYKAPTYVWDADQGMNVMTNPGSGKKPEGMPDENAYWNFQSHNNTQFTGPMAQQWNLVGSKLKETLGLINPAERVELLDSVGGLYQDDLADAIYNRTTRMSKNSMEEAREQLEARLAERGFSVGMEGYNNEMNRYERSLSEHYSDAADRAQIQAAAQALQEGNFTNQSRLSEFNTNTGYKNNLVNMLAGIQSNMANGLYGGAQLAMGGGGMPGSGGMDMSGLLQQYYQNELAQYNAGVQEDNALWGLGLTAASMFFPPAALAAPAVMQSPAQYQAPNYSLYNPQRMNSWGTLAPRG